LANLFEVIDRIDRSYELGRSLELVLDELISVLLVVYLHGVISLLLQGLDSLDLFLDSLVRARRNLSELLVL
jgi:hypothetical protein